MPAEHLTVGEFVRTMERVETGMEAGFGGINIRLDTLNEQARRHGESIAAHDARLMALEARPDGVGAMVPEGMSKKKAMAWGGAGTILVTLLQYVATHLPGWLNQP